MLYKGLSKSSPIPQFESIYYTVFSLLHYPTLNPYMTTGKTIALTRWNFVGKVMFLLFIILSRLVIFSSKEQACFNFMAAVTVHSDFGAQENKSVTVFIVSPSICHEVMDWMP